MNLQEAKRQWRLKRIKNQILHEKRLRIPSVPDISYVGTPFPVLNWWQRLLRYFKSFLNAKPRPATIQPPK